MSASTAPITITAGKRLLAMLLQMEAQSGKRLTVTDDILMRHARSVTTLQQYGATIPPNKPIHLSQDLLLGLFANYDV